MSFTFAHQKVVQGGGVPLPDGNVYDTSGYANPQSFSIIPCPGTGVPAATYNKTVYVRSENSLFYDYNINGGAFTASTPVPGGPPITGNFDWNFTIAVPTNGSSMQQTTSVPITLRLRPVADVTAVAKIINFTLVIERCARPVNSSVSFTPNLYSCSNVGATSSNLTFSTGIVANAASSTINTPQGQYNNLYNGFVQPAATSANAGFTYTVNINSISGVSSDGLSYAATVTNIGEYWCDPCGGMCYTNQGCFNRFEDCNCPNPGSCVPAGTCITPDCRGSPAGCAGGYVFDECRSLCVPAGTAYERCTECSGGMPAVGVCSPPGTCHAADCRGVGGGGCAGGFVDCDCPSPGSCVASCVTRDCNGVCGGSAVQDCAGACGGTAVDCGCGCNNPCVSCPGGGVSCGGAPCPAAPPSCNYDPTGGGPFSCCGCPPGGFAGLCSCTGDASQNCSVSGMSTSGPFGPIPGASFSAPCIDCGTWNSIANCDGSNPCSPVSATITCDNGSATVSP